MASPHTPSKKRNVSAPSALHAAHKAFGKSWHIPVLQNHADGSASGVANSTARIVHFVVYPLVKKNPRARRMVRAPQELRKVIRRVQPGSLRRKLQRKIRKAGVRLNPVAKTRPLLFVQVQQNSGEWLSMAHMLDTRENRKVAKKMAHVYKRIPANRKRLVRVITE